MLIIRESEVISWATIETKQFDKRKFINGMQLKSI